MLVYQRVQHGGTSPNGDVIHYGEILLEGEIFLSGGRFQPAQMGIS